MLDRLGAHPAMSGRRHLRILAAGAGLPPARVHTVLDAVGLGAAADRPVRTYSTGMRQRLALGAALVGRPPILLLDEPASGLDVLGIAWLRDLMRAHAAAGGTVLISTHQLAELAGVVDDLVLIDAGRVLASGPVAEVLARTGADTIEAAVLAELRSHR